VYDHTETAAYAQQKAQFSGVGGGGAPAGSGEGGSGGRGKAAQ
jgi:hypothetical protein